MFKLRMSAKHMQNNSVTIVQAQKLFSFLSFFQQKKQNCLAVCRDFICPIGVLEEEKRE